MEVAEHLRPQKPYREAGFQWLPIGAMIIFTILTFGLYGFYWYLSRKKAINHLNTKKRFPFWYIWLTVILIFIEMFSQLYYGFIESHPPEWYEDFTTLFFMVGTFVNHFLNVYLRRMMLEHEGRDLTFSSQVVTYLLSFLLGIFYIQFLINKDYKGEKRPEEYTKEEEGDRFIAKLKKINWYNVIAAITLFIKIVTTIMICFFMTVKGAGLAIVLTYFFLRLPSAVISLLFIILSLMLRKKKKVAWTILAVYVLDTVIVFVGIPLLALVVDVIQIGL